MRVELLNSAIPPSDLQFLVTFLVNDEVAIDAGAIGLLADLRRQQRVKHVFITHEHLDHIATLPIFLENVYEPGPQSVEVLAAGEVLEFLHGDMFNGRVWPDFIEMSEPSNAFMRTTAIEPWQPITRAGLTITAVPVSHGIDTLGLVVDDGTSAVAFPSDTGPTQRIWQHLAAIDRLTAVFLEASFPQSLSDLAAQTGHLCPATFAAEVKKLPQEVRWIVVHRKSRYAEKIAQEINALGLPNVEFVRPGHVYEL
ncbi:MAG: 3',5'-cyclic-nucleotide phosphodiesterase [Planctomycetota bacterium]